MRVAALGRVLAVGALIVLSGAGRAAEESERTQQQLQAVEDALRNAKARAEELGHQADAAAARIADLQAQTAAVAQRAQDSESTLSQLEEELRKLEKSEAATRADLMGEQSRLVDSLAAMQRLSMQPREAMILRPGAPIDTVRSAMLLRVAVSALQERASALRQGLDRLRDLRVEIARRRAGQESSAAALRAENERLAGLLQQMQEAQQSAAAEREETGRRLEALSARSKDLRDLLDKLEGERKTQEAKERQEAALPPPAASPEAPPSAEPEASVPRASPAATRRIRAFPTDGKGVVLPARGRLVERFGEPGAAGFKNRGIALQTRAGADVVAPFDGQVVFRGPFSGYGEILLIAHRGGYYTVLAGLGRTVATVGQWLVAGEPVGMMGPSDAGNPKLYVELRRGDDPIDPAPWLGLRDR
jgi:septal ring factor EnvC (AmiA/AmiB activator)